MNDFLYNPTLTIHKSVVGALKVNQEAKINLYINKYFNIYDLKIVIFDEKDYKVIKQMNEEKQNDDYKIYSVSLSFSKPYIYWYYFEFNDCYGKHFLGAEDNLDIYLTNENVNCYQINVYENSFNDLSWYKGKVMYQIMVDRFNKGNYFDEKYYQGKMLHSNWLDTPNYLPVNGKILNNDFFGGNFQGIIEKIPYLKQLNVSVIYLNPIFLAPSNHKYNTSDYLTIDPMFGTEDDFKNLIHKLKENNISLILDGVFNHTGDDSIYFNKYANFDVIGAYQSPKSEYYDWYKFIKYPNKYESWWGIDTLPAVNQKSTFTNFITEKVIKKWIDMGIKGFRLDVVDELDESFLCDIVKNIKEKDKTNIVIGEVWEDASNKIAYDTRKHYFQGNELDSVMNYPLKNAIIDYLKNGSGLHLINTIRHLTNNYPKCVLDSLMNILSTHDTARILTEFSDINYYTLSLEERANYHLDKAEYYNARSKLKMATILIYTLPGVPCIYYGDETGLEGYKDPFCRRTIPWDDLNKDIIKWYTKLGEIRNDKVYIEGIYEELFYDNDVFAFSRKTDDYEIITIVNNSQYEYQFNISYGYDLIDDIEINNYIIIYPQTGKIIKRSLTDEKIS